MDLPLIIGRYVPEIAGMAVGVIGQSMLVPLRVVVPAGAHRIGRGAIAVLVDVKSVLLPRPQTFQIRNHFYRLAGLSETHHPPALLAGSRRKHSYRVLGAGTLRASQPN